MAASTVLPGFYNRFLLRPEVTSDILRSAQTPSCRTKGFPASPKFSRNSQRNFDMFGRKVNLQTLVKLCLTEVRGCVSCSAKALGLRLPAADLQVKSAQSIIERITGL